jgi:hypothetical protein
VVNLEKFKTMLNPKWRWKCFYLLKITNMVILFTGNRLELWKKNKEHVKKILRIWKNGRLILAWNIILQNLFFFQKKNCVAYPHEDFLFTILYEDSWKPSKSIFNTSKVKKNKNTYEIYQTKFAGSPKIKKKKIIGTPNLQIRKKIFPKKVCLVP